MVWLTRFDGTQFLINADLIELAEPTPDTVITLTNGHRFVVREAADELVERIVAYRRRIHALPGTREDRDNWGGQA